jgi:redox-sensitive bicupin YhaK (pirin superfamily)
MAPALRAVMQVTEPHMVMEGAGVRLLRSFGPSRQNRFDPFLLFDHFAFNDPREDPIAGFPTHPHRGIETVTYMLEGTVRHRDSLGNMGVIGPGDVQWMTSGRGILHEEMPQRSEAGIVNGFQLWVNLPAVRKMSAPRYQEIQAASIPVLTESGVRLRLVAGDRGEMHGPVRDISARPLYMDVALDPGSEVDLPAAPGHTTLAYIFEGEGDFGIEAGGRGEHVSGVKMLRFGDGDVLRVRAGSGGGLRFMVMAGAPFGEPIVPYGPFVMNTEQEIQQALDDLRAGTFVTA